jgi:deazaflavin-dependent oxidoreductase (nitroreductase family)
MLVMSGFKQRIVRGRSMAHHRVFAVTRGRVLGRWGGHDVLELTTRGRQSGRPRSVILACLVTEGESLVVVASDGGAPRHPAWYINLRADPAAEVVREGRRARVRARTAEGDERERLWRRITQVAPAYGRYQQRTERILPVVVLEPDR